MTSLSDFYSLEVTRQQAQLSTAQTAASQASQAELAAGNQLLSINQALSLARSDAAAARKALALIPLPADGDPLLLALRSALRAEASAQSAQVSAAAELSQARANRARADAWAALLAQRLAQLNLQAKAAQTATQQRTAWLSAAATAAPDDAPSLAAAVLSEYNAAAKGKIEADFPSHADADKNFLSRVRARRSLAASALSLAQTRQADADALATAWAEASGRAAAKLPALHSRLAAADAALQQLSLAPAQIDSARQQLKALAERPSSPLSAAQRAELFATGNTALASEREAALAALSLRDAAQNTYFARRQDYARALLPLQIAHPGASEADLRALDTSLDTHFSDLNAAAQALADADNDPALAAHRNTLMDWFNAVPEALWQQLEAYDSSLAQLTQIQALVPADLISALQNAENALVTQLQAQRDEDMQNDLRERLVAQTHSQTAASTEVATTRLRAAGRFVGMI